MPPVPLGNRTKMESTAALLPKHGSRAMGFGTDCGGKGNRQILLVNGGRGAASSKRRITPALLFLFLFVSATSEERERNLFHPLSGCTLICRASAFPESPTVHKFTTMRAGETLPKIKWRSGVRGSVSPGALPSPQAPPIHT